MGEEDETTKNKHKVRAYFDTKFENNKKQNEFLKTMGNLPGLRESEMGDGGNDYRATKSTQHLNDNDQSDQQQATSHLQNDFENGVGADYVLNENDYKMLDANKKDENK